MLLLIYLWFLSPFNFSTTPPWARKYEPLSTIFAPIAPSLESLSILELKPPSITHEYIGPNDMFLVPNASDPTFNLETQFWSMLEEQIEEILNKQGTERKVMNHLSKMDNYEIIIYLSIMGL